MHLVEWVRKTGVTLGAFALFAGYDRVYLSQVMNGNKPLTDKFLLRMTEVTMGQVCSSKDILIKKKRVEKKAAMKRKRRKVKPPMSFKELMEHPRISNDLPENWGKLKGDDY